MLLRHDELSTLKQIKQYKFDQKVSSLILLPNFLKSSSISLFNELSLRIICWSELLKLRSIIQIDLIIRCDNSLKSEIEEAFKKFGSKINELTFWSNLYCLICLICSIFSATDYKYMKLKSFCVSFCYGKKFLLLIWYLPCFVLLIELINEPATTYYFSAWSANFFKLFLLAEV